MRGLAVDLDRFQLNVRVVTPEPEPTRPASLTPLRWLDSAPSEGRAHSSAFVTQIVGLLDPMPGSEAAPAARAASRAPTPTSCPL